ncbi:hypothetical protein [Flavobacterium sp. '19STA2R22 D10 B1']|uniref:hypothetical protein n=1 Tax=Flavobacterium aerium TaxID=3037261 RepID=UPI00278C6934|nr:hypothetical protein [Flavobacterium sp. '19STA2R22 D10 B1']
MKNLFLTAALVLGLGFNATASTVSVQGTKTEMNQEKEYKKIEASEISSDALKQIGTKYAGYSLQEANVAADGEYKLVLSKDGANVTALFTAAGEFIKEV